MTEDQQNNRKNQIRLVIAAVIFIVFCLIDTFNAKYDKILRKSLSEKFNTIDELDVSQNTDNSATIAIENAETNKKLINIFVLLTGFALLILWVSLDLKHKFAIISFLLIYLAGMKFMDYELLYQWSLNADNMLIARHVITRVFPAVLFLILTITVEFYKPLPKDLDFELNFAESKS